MAIQDKIRQDKTRQDNKKCLPGRVVLGSATTGALPKTFETIFKSEDMRQSV